MQVKGITPRPTPRPTPNWAAKPYELLAEAYHAANSAELVIKGYHPAGVGVVVQNWKEIQTALEVLPGVIMGLDVLSTILDIYVLCDRNRRDRWGRSRSRVVSSWDALTLFLEVRGVIEEHRAKQLNRRINH